tara:strand:+ start:1843 stop:2451 length:609 start_codon:yes stop_codon:yes gene_type:complete
MVKLEGLFSSLMLTDQLNDVVDNDDIISYCYDLRKDDEFLGNWSSGRLPLEHLDNTPLDKLKYEILDRTNTLKQSMGVKEDLDVTIKNYWANIYEPSSKQVLPSTSPHMHSNYFLSAVYYPKAMQNAGCLTLMAPFTGLEHTLTYLHIETPGYFNANKWHIAPEPGKLIIFPSWLMHYVEDNNSSEDRISIAFNISLPHLDV